MSHFDWIKKNSHDLDESVNAWRTILLALKATKSFTEDRQIENMSPYDWINAHSHDLDESGNAWRTILLALKATKTTISELVMDTNSDVGLERSAFELLPPELEDAKVRIQNLVKLRLNLSVPCDVGEHSYILHQNVPELLSAATSLKCLALEACDVLCVSLPETTLLQAMLGGCEFPKLKTLILGYFSSTETELLRLLQGSPKLEEFALEGHELTLGTWEYVASEARATLSLKDVTFNWIRGGFQEPSKDLTFLDSFGYVKRFFSREGENPFTKEEFGRYQADIKSKEDEIDGAGCIERLRMF